MPLLPRFHRQQEQARDAQAVDKVVTEAVEPAPITGVTAGGDQLRLKGLPGRGVQGAIWGSSPVGALIGKESRNGNGRLR